MKNGWPTVSLSDVCEFMDRRGVTPKKLGSDFLSAGYRVISAKNVKGRQIDLTVGEQRFVDESTYRKWMNSPLLADDVLLTSEAPLGEPAYIAEELQWCLGQRLFGIRTNKSKLQGRFLFYALQSDVVRRDLLSRATGATAQGIRQAELRLVAMPAPTLPEQRRIVGILDEAIEGIATAKANAAKNLQNARALFESHLNAVFTQRGDGWTSATVGELVEQQLLAKPLDGNHGEIHPKKSDFVNSGVPFIMAAHLSNGAVDQENCYFITKKQANSLRKGFAKDGDVLLSHKGTIGRVAVLETSHDFVVLTPQVTFYRILDDTVLHNRYLYFFFQSPKFQDEINGIAGGGSTRAYIGITKQQELTIDYPRLDDQQQIASTFEDLARETERLESIYQRKLAALDEMKKSLLHQAFSGEL